MTERDRIAEFKEVVEMMPDDPVVRFGLAGAYLEMPYADAEGLARMLPDLDSILDFLPKFTGDPVWWWSSRPGLVATV